MRSTTTTTGLSVLLPVRAPAPFLARALRSLARSRGVSFELVLVVHGADDGFVDRARRHVERAVVRPVFVDDGADLAAVLEAGRAKAGGRALARMDADDVVHPDRLARDLKALDDDPRLDAVTSRVRWLSRARPEGRYLRWINAMRTDDEHRRGVWIEQPVVHPAVTFRAASFERWGGYRSGPFPEDYELFLRWLTGGARVQKRPEVHLGWREHEGRLTHREPARYARDVFAGLKARALVEHFGVDERPVFVLGAGKEGRRMNRALRALGVSPAAVFDVDPRKIGRIRSGVGVRAIDELATAHAAAPDAFAIGAVGSSGARPIVRAALAHAGFVEGETAVVVA